VSNISIYQTPGCLVPGGSGVTPRLRPQADANVNAWGPNAALKQVAVPQTQVVAKQHTPLMADEGTTGFPPSAVERRP
jgi:hypothetical protein